MSRTFTWCSAAACALGLAAVLASCSYLKYEPVVMLPPTIPGATYIGSPACLACHEKVGQYFRLDPHFAIHVKEDEDADMDEQDPNAQPGACESCHGPRSLHMEGEGDKTKIIRYSYAACVSCHVEKAGQFRLQFHHPVPEGHMTCMDCHETHGKDVRAKGIARLKRREETCFKCHKTQKGPFVFEHDAMRDGCQVCHNPHGSVHDKMLVAGDTTVCLRCHWEHSFDRGVATGFGSNRIGGVGHNFFIGRGQDCIDCHRAVHGSNVWRSLNR